MEERAAGPQLVTLDQVRSAVLLHRDRKNLASARARGRLRPMHHALDDNATCTGWMVLLLDNAHVCTWCDVRTAGCLTDNKASLGPQHVHG